MGLKRPAVGCVVLDLDDTLFLERDYVRSGFTSVGVVVAERFGVTDFASRAWQRFESGDRGDIFDRVLLGLGIESTPALIQELVECYRAHEPQIALLPDARLAIDRLHGVVPMAVISDGPLSSQQAKARALESGRWSSTTVLTSGWGTDFSKPHPRAFEYVARVVDARGGSFVYVADNPAKDFIAPHALGWTTVRVRRPESLHEAVASGADVHLEVSDVLTAIDALELRET